MRVTLADKFQLESGQVFLSGTQALVRLPLMQRAVDAAAGLNTAGYITGYRGSPLGGYDMQLWSAQALLREAHVRFAPGVNEDLAATAIWGTQQVGLLPGAKYDGVFSIWYGKGPGVDRSGDPIKHANRMGTSRHGGVLLVFGDDHPGKSSTVPHQSEQALAANGVPVLYPSTVQEYLDFGLYGWALSRFAGLWVGFKCVNETVETTATVSVDPMRVRVRTPAQAAFPPEGVHARLAFDPAADEIRLMRFKLPLAQAFVRANALDRTIITPQERRLAIVSAGKSYVDVQQALCILGLDATRAAALGVGLYKPAMIWPLEPTGLTDFARGFQELLVVEEKAAFLEPQIAHVLFNLHAAERPRLSGKTAPSGATLLAADVQLEPTQIARVIAQRLLEAGVADERLRARLELLDRQWAISRSAPPSVRTPYFCSGCPHNSSTRVPEGSIAFSGIGCHTMALMMNRSTLPPTHMGGEGMTWAGIAPFTSLPHAFQNLGDGTYFHSGLLAIRGAVQAGANITFKILVNDAVAMTGGQPVEGGLSVAEITRQLAAERVRRIAVVSDEPGKYRGRRGFASGVTVHHRNELLELQRQLRQAPGVTAIVYEQACAAEKRRRRKRGQLADPPRRAFINERVCEGCGDCSVQSNCVSIEPVETQFGRKRRINQSSCNKDFSCIEGFCPAFALVEGASPRRRQEQLDASLLDSLPEPGIATFDHVYSILVAGIGGTGVLTVGALLGMAAHIEGKGASVFDMTGLAQKGGAVVSHLRITANADRLSAPRIGLREADVVLGCDLVVAAGSESMQSIDGDRTRVVLNTHLAPTAAFQLNPDVDFHEAELVKRVTGATQRAWIRLVDASGAVERMLGDTIAANVFMLGYALQAGLLPVSRASIEEAVRLNGVAVEFNLKALALGRLAAHAPERMAPSPPAPAPQVVNLDELVSDRAGRLTTYQNEAYAMRYRALVQAAWKAEESRTPGRDGFALAVARCYYKLLAYKDEYEVARLYTDGEFLRVLNEQLESVSGIRLLLAPPLLARRYPSTGQPVKREFGSWIFPVMRLLARLKGLRGTKFDPFGYSAERRMERRLIVEYEDLVKRMIAELTPENRPVAIELASLPERIRGFGHVKTRHLAAAEARRRELLAQWPNARDSEHAESSKGLLAH